ncbi:hypothetical protein BKK79_33820 [Cupriavidus sp. USMAA2-4]|uniref:diguanylate cyclase n=1 Tax=Cupriavidus malaysiensis TaxID=367825 RepID=A0ABN4TSV8_9BURK|nr:MULTISPECIES: GGDEF domain-containing protein [Cupriavidus]AOY96525.1 hypothetical protein BKK79_33820 [Cupriavidus sp. USMAA2-4]AOZ09564.1 hypothetical protein BKK80_27905 [Cupriavidus malaysiensis]
MSPWLPKLDLPTALLFAGISYALLAAVVFTLWQGSLGRRGGGWWLWNEVVLAVGTLILLTTPVLPRWLVLSLSNILLFFSLPLLGAGLNDFLHRAARTEVLWLWAMGVAAASLWVLTYVTDAGYTARSVAVTAGLTLQGVALFSVVAKHGDRLPTAARRLFQGALIVLLLTCLERLGRLAYSDTASPVAAIPDALLLTLAGQVANFAFVCAMLIFLHTEQQEKLLLVQQQLEFRANTDSLTGVASRSHFEATAAGWLAHAALQDQPLALMLLDVDRFKEVNDRFGHLAGDQVLRELGALLRALAGADGLSGRLGGDEFAVLVGSPEAEAVHEMAARLHQLAACVHLPDGQPLRLSIGAVRFRLGETFDEAYARADRGLYDAKQGGPARPRRSIMAANDAAA